MDKQEQRREAVSDADVAQHEATADSNQAQQSRTSDGSGLHLLALY